MVGEADSPEPTEAAEVVEAAAVAKVRDRKSQGVLGTPLNPQRPVVNATTFMVTRLGTAWHPSHVPGSTRWLQEPENQTSLTRRISKKD